MNDLTGYVADRLLDECVRILNRGYVSWTSTEELTDHQEHAVRHLVRTGLMEGRCNGEAIFAGVAGFSFRIRASGAWKSLVTERIACRLPVEWVNENGVVQDERLVIDVAEFDQIRLSSCGIDYHERSEDPDEVQFARDWIRKASASGSLPTFVVEQWAAAAKQAPGQIVAAQAIASPTIIVNVTTADPTTTDCSAAQPAGDIEEERDNRTINADGISRSLKARGRPASSSTVGRITAEASFPQPISEKPVKTWTFNAVNEWFRIHHGVDLIHADDLTGK